MKKFQPYNRKIKPKVYQLCFYFGKFLSTLILCGRTLWMLNKDADRSLKVGKRVFSA